MKTHNKWKKSQQNKELITKIKVKSFNKRKKSLQNKELTTK